ncbi:MAG TPA: hypothetical protein VGV15_08040, partial [Terriglobales bacterium]|nr:hypothetical protein [Terriglobales bacterium]
MSSRTRRQEMIAIASVACMALLVFATLKPAAAQEFALATESAGFDSIGFIQAATIDTPGGTGAASLLSGGTIKINDRVIIVPKNSIVQMPAATLSWGQVFAQAPANVSNLGTAT